MGREMGELARALEAPHSPVVQEVSRALVEKNPWKVETGMSKTLVELMAHKALAGIQADHNPMGELEVHRAAPVVRVAMA